MQVPMFYSLLQEKRKRQDERKKLAEALGDKAPPKLVPKTIDSMRESDETTVQPTTTTDGEEKVDEEVVWDITNDEFKEYFGKTYEPKVLLTSADNPHSVGGKKHLKQKNILKLGGCLLTHGTLYCEP